jgi:hypothetical protein
MIFCRALGFLLKRDADLKGSGKTGKKMASGFLTKRTDEFSKVPGRKV